VLMATIVKNRFLAIAQNDNTYGVHGSVGSSRRNRGLPMNLGPRGNVAMPATIVTLAAGSPMPQHAEVFE
jgi:hypothetical protein